MTEPTPINRDYGKPNEKTAKMREAKHQAALRMSDAAGGRTPDAWRHYKGGVYKVLGYGWDTATDTPDVRYVRIAGPDFRIGEEQDEFHRTVDDWLQEVLIPTEPNGDIDVRNPDRYVKRFTPVYKVERHETWEEIARRGTELG